ncbi:MAG: hypothetical protein KAT86_01460, partial [Candidatus Latescibacteria bacterium]|nr:hypothetical protein [Candidatus Latescibacterota bacterium]
MATKDTEILRELAKQYQDICADPVQEERRALWRKHNSLKGTRPLIYVRAFAWHEMPQSECMCENPFFRQYEDFFRRHLFWNTFDDDSIFEPWVTVQATRTCNGWGVSGERNFSDEPGGSFKVDYPIKQLSDMETLRVPWHGVDEKKTSENAERLSNTIGDIIAINVDRGPAYRMWTGDLSTDLGYLRGIEHFMVDMLDNPDWLHRLVRFMSDGVLKTHDEAERAGDWGLCAHQNQAMPYAEELKDPAPNVNGVERSQLWGYIAAQELTAVSPAMHDEFMLQYQLPILKPFGLVAYGCCEDLTNKIDMLRQIPNLRRIAVSPFADVVKCAEQIGRDYVVSYRPSPADMVSYGFDRDRIRSILTTDLETCKDCHV